MSVQLYLVCYDHLCESVFISFLSINLQGSPMAASLLCTLQCSILHFFILKSYSATNVELTLGKPFSSSAWRMHVCHLGMMKCASCLPAVNLIMHILPFPSIPPALLVLIRSSSSLLVKIINSVDGQILTFICSWSAIKEENC